MTYLITQIFLCLVIALLLGGIVGYLLCKICCKSNKSVKCCDKKEENDPAPATVIEPIEEDDTATISLDTNVDLDDEGYNIETLEGVGPQTGDLLRGYGVKTVGDLLRKLHTPVSREQAAKDLNILAKPIHDWASMSDLLRVEGVNHQYAELLYTAGIITVTDLAHSNAEELLSEMDTVNSAGKQKISPELPIVEEVEDWIARARGMSPVVSV